MSLCGLALRLTVSGRAYGCCIVVTHAGQGFCVQISMLPAALAPAACRILAGHAAAQHRLLTCVASSLVSSCRPRLHCLQRSSTEFKRSRLRQYARRGVRTSCASAEAERAGSSGNSNGFEWATNVSRHGNVYFAIDETSQACLASLGDSAAEPTVALLFASSSYSVEFDRIVPVLRSKVPSLQHIVGCTVSLLHPSAQSLSL